MDSNQDFKNIRNAIRGERTRHATNFINPLRATWRITSTKVWYEVLQIKERLESCVWRVVVPNHRFLSHRENNVQLPYQINIIYGEGKFWNSIGVPNGTLQSHRFKFGWYRGRR